MKENFYESIDRLDTFGYCFQIYTKKKERERDYYPRRIFKASEKSSRSFNERQREKYDRICPVGLSRKQASKKFTEKASRTPFAGRLAVEKKNSNYWRNG